VNDKNLERAARLDTTSISDALDRLGIAGQCLNIKPLDPRFRLSGRAFTILYGPAGQPPGTVGDYIDEVETGRVVVLDNGGRENATVWGDILTFVAHQRVMRPFDGEPRIAEEYVQLLDDRPSGVRDVERTGQPLNIGDARVHPGDLMRGDADGVLVIPLAHEDAVLSAAEEIDAIEQQIRAAIKDGKTLAEARRQLGYHQLQSRRK
jgi:regulator of RNase E activity RraA